MRRIRAAGRGVLLAIAMVLICAPAATASTIFFAESSSVNFEAGSLWSVRSDGSGLRKLRGGLPEGPGGVVASISRDGKHLFCLCHGTEIDTMKLDGSGFKKVGNRPTRIKYDYTVLGPEGEPFWFQGTHLMTASRDGKHERLVAKGPLEEELAIPRRGGRIAIGGGNKLFTASLSGGPLTKIYHSAFSGFRQVGEMSWSADGKKLVFVDYAEEEKYETPAEPASHAYLYSGGTVREIPLAEEVTYGPPVFSPSATRLASIGEEGSIFLSGLGAGRPKRILKRHCGETCFFGPRLLGWLN